MLNSVVALAPGRVDSNIDAWTIVSITRGTGVEMSLDAARTSACATSRLGRASVRRGVLFLELADGFPS